MKLIVDIRCKFPPTEDPVRLRYMAFPVVEKRTACYKDELRRNPKNAVAYYCLSQLYFYHKRYKEVLPYLRKCLKLSFCPEDIIPWLSVTYYRLGMLRQEIKLYQSCLKSNPKDKWAKRRLKFALKDVNKENLGNKTWKDLVKT